MSASIGSLTVDVFNGFIAPGTARPQVDVWERPGVDGIGFQALPDKPTPVRVHTVIDKASQSAAISDANSYLALIGTQVAIVDQFGYSWDTVLINECQPRWTKTLTAWRLEAIWEMTPQ